MSINILSGKYNVVSAASQAINNAIIAFKKKNLIDNAGTKYPQLTVTGPQLSDARESLVEFLEDIQRSFNGKATEGKLMPPEIYAVYIKKIEEADGIEGIKAQLPGLINALKNEGAVSGEGFKALDTLISALDNQRSVWFRQLRISRG